MLDIRIDTSDLEDFVKYIPTGDHATIERAAGIALYESVNTFVIPRAMALAPSKSGMLRNNIYAKMLGFGSVSIVSDVPYAGYQEFGFWHARGQYQVEGRYFVQNAIVEALPEITSRVANTIVFEILLKNIGRR